MSTANEFQIEIFISLADCNIDNIPYFLPTAAKRSSTKRDKEYSIRFSLVFVFFQKLLS